MGVAHLGKKLGPVRRVHFAAPPPIQLAGQRTDRPIDINKLALVTVAHHGSQGGRRPAAFGTHPTPKACLVLEHQAHGAAWDDFGGQQGCQRFGKFFSTPPGPWDRFSGAAYRAPLSATRAAPGDGTPPRGRFSVPTFRPAPPAEVKRPALPPAEPVRPTEPGTLLPLPNSATPVAVRPISFGAAKASAGSGEIVVAGGAPRPVRLPAVRPSAPGWYR